MHDKLFNKVNAIDTGGFVPESQYSTDKSGLEKKINDGDKNIPDSNGLVKKIIMLRSLRLKIKQLVLMV